VLENAALENAVLGATRRPSRKKLEFFLKETVVDRNRRRVQTFSRSSFSSLLPAALPLKWEARHRANYDFFSTG
jgi:hypothetical protein